MTTDKLICVRCDTAPPGFKPDTPPPTESCEKNKLMRKKQTARQWMPLFLPHGIAEASRTAARPAHPALGGWVGAKNIRDTIFLTKMPTLPQPRPSRDKALHHHNSLGTEGRHTVLVYRPGKVVPLQRSKHHSHAGQPLRGFSLLLKIARLRPAMFNIKVQKLRFHFRIQAFGVVFFLRRHC